MPIRNTSYKYTSVILEWNFDVFCFICEDAYLLAHLLPNTLAKFTADLYNSENGDNGEET